jgi:hypothetical protein
MQIKINEQKQEEYLKNKKSQETHNATLKHDLRRIKEEKERLENQYLPKIKETRKFQ